MKKSEDIIRLLSRLQLASRGWQVLDHWEADLCAIGIAKARNLRRLVYISTYGLGPGKYSYQCETPAGADSYITDESGDDVDYDELLRVIQAHLS